MFHKDEICIIIYKKLQIHNIQQYTKQKFKHQSEIRPKIPFTVAFPYTSTREQNLWVSTCANMAIETV